MTKANKKTEIEKKEKKWKTNSRNINIDRVHVNETTHST